MTDDARSILDALAAALAPLVAEQLAARGHVAGNVAGDVHLGGETQVQVRTDPQVKVVQSVATVPPSENPVRGPVEVHVNHDWPRALDPEAVAARLGLHVDTVRSMLRAGSLPGRKVGGVWRVDPVELERRLRDGHEAKRTDRRRAADARAWIKSEKAKRSTG